MNLTFDINNNGLKVLRVEAPGERAFSVQTNGALPLTHHMTGEDLLTPCWHVQVLRELSEYVAACGTQRQKRILDNYRSTLI